MQKKAGKANYLVSRASSFTREGLVNFALLICEHLPQFFGMLTTNDVHQRKYNLVQCTHANHIVSIQYCVVWRTLNSLAKITQKNATV